MNNISIYIHWPFCLAKCPYCDFNSHVASPPNHKLWLKSYQREIDYFGEIIKGKYIKSIFFGGGTPSLMEPFVVKGVIDKLGELGIINAETEITLEANPTSYEINKFIKFKLAGVNRVSIGVQSLRADDLQKLGRQHNVEEAKEAIKSAKDIFPRSSFDLIYARSSQTLSDWQEELIEAMELAGGHISLYQLTIEKGTPFYKLFKEGNLTLPSNHGAANMYEWTNSYLQSQGYKRYEISNYALAAQECKHNLVYWHYYDYLGIGPGAHSRLSNIQLDSLSIRGDEFKSEAALAMVATEHRRDPENSLVSSLANDAVAGSKDSMMMHHLPEKWLRMVEETGHGIQALQALTGQEMIEEFLMMGLRLPEGVTSTRFQQLTGFKLEEAINAKMAEYYMELGLVYWDKINLKLTDKGLLLHSYLVPRLLV